jgi:hypothetical protein
VEARHLETVICPGAKDAMSQQRSIQNRLDRSDAWIFRLTDYLSSWNQRSSSACSTKSRTARAAKSATAIAAAYAAKQSSREPQCSESDAAGWIMLGDLVANLDRPDVTAAVLTTLDPIVASNTAWHKIAAITAGICDPRNGVQ